MIYKNDLVIINVLSNLLFHLFIYSMYNFKDKYWFLYRKNTGNILENMLPVFNYLLNKGR